MRGALPRALIHAQPSNDLVTRCLQPEKGHQIQMIVQFLLWEQLGIDTSTKLLGRILMEREFQIVDMATEECIDELTPPMFRT